MSRLNSIAPEQATGKTAELFRAVQKKMGMVPIWFALWEIRQPR